MKFGAQGAVYGFNGWGLTLTHEYVVYLRRRKAQKVQDGHVTIHPVHDLIHSIRFMNQIGFTIQPISHRIFVHLLSVSVLFVYYVFIMSKYCTVFFR